MVHANYYAPYPKQPCVVHEANMWCLYCMTLSVLESSTKFSQVLWSVLWLCHQVVTDVTVWPINPNPSCSKNRKIKNKKWNRKLSPLFVNLTGYIFKLVRIKNTVLDSIKLKSFGNYLLNELTNYIKQNNRSESLWSTISKFI